MSPPLRRNSFEYGIFQQSMLRYDYSINNNHNKFVLKKWLKALNWKKSQKDEEIYNFLDVCSIKPQ